MPAKTPRVIINPRERSYDTSMGTSRMYTRYNANGTIHSTGQQAVNLNWNGETGQMTDIVTPNWKELIASGKILNNPMSKKKSISSVAPANWQLNNSNGTKFVYTGSDAIGESVWPHTVQPSRGTPVPTTLAGVDINEADVQNDAVVKALSNVGSADTLALVTLAELHKTVGTITDVVGGLVKGIKLLAGGSPKKAVLRALMGSKYKEPKAKDLKWGVKSLSGKWLEVRYAWCPMIYDLEGTLAALNAIRYPRLTARGNSLEEAPKTTTGETVIDATFNHRFQWKVTEKVSYSVRAYVLYTVDENWFKAHRLGLLCPLETVWELVPFSFVIDWFVDIGSWLSAITPRVGVKTLCMGHTTRSQYDRVFEVLSTTSGAGSSINGLAGVKNSFTAFELVRHTFLPPVLPPIRVRLNSKRAIDSIALLVQLGSKVR